MKEKKDDIYLEIVLMRSIGCLSIVAFHALGYANGYLNKNLIDQIKLVLTFGTPMFIFISEFLLARTYRTMAPKNFLKSRIKFVLVPYLCMAFIYAIPDSIACYTKLHDLCFKQIVSIVLKNVLFGDFHGWFILVVCQFYFLHFIFIKYLQKVNGVAVMIASFIINIVYLSFFNLCDPINIPYAQYIWTHLYWLPFIGWIYYFSLAFYCGYYIESFQRFCNKSRKYIVIAPLSMLLLINNNFYKMTVDSKRVDVILYATVMIIVFCVIGSKVRKLPKILRIVNKYSFNIFWLHVSFQEVWLYVNKFYIQVNYIVYFMVSIFGALIYSILLARLIHKFKCGNYLIGKTLKA